MGVPLGCGDSGCWQLQQLPRVPRVRPGPGPARCNEPPRSQLREPCARSHRQARTCEGCAEHGGGCGGARLAPSCIPGLGAGGGSVRSPISQGSPEQGCWLGSASPRDRTRVGLSCARQVHLRSAAGMGRSWRTRGPLPWALACVATADGCAGCLGAFSWCLCRI